MPDPSLFEVAQATQPRRGPSPLRRDCTAGRAVWVHTPPSQGQAVAYAQTPPQARLPRQGFSRWSPMNPSGEIDGERHHGGNVVPAFYRIRDVIRMTALTRATLYRRISAGRFPPPVHLGGRVCAWPRTALQAWIADPEHYRAPQLPGLTTRRSRGRPRKYATT